jgi:hypothetical protein
MKESSTYQAIVEEGRTEGAIAEARKLLRRLGDKTLGPPDAPTAAALNGIADLERLETLCERVSSATSWQQLLGQPPAGRRGGRRGRTP